MKSFSTEARWISASLASSSSTLRLEGRTAPCSITRHSVSLRPVLRQRTNQSVLCCASKRRLRSICFGRRSAARGSGSRSRTGRR